MNGHFRDSKGKLFVPKAKHRPAFINNVKCVCGRYLLFQTIIETNGANNVVVEAHNCGDKNDG